MAYDFPPFNSVGGQRPYSWLKHFKRQDVFPIVITRNWSKKCNELVHKKEDNGEIYYSPYEDNFRDKTFKKYGQNKFVFFRKSISLIIRVTQYFTDLVDPKSTIFKTAELVLKKQQIDYIIACGEPFILFKYAHKLSKTYQTPWFADYRDDWIFNHDKANKIEKIFKWYESFFEKKYLSNVKGVISVTDHILNDISKRTNINNNIKIENGVDLELIKKGQNILSQNDFNIVYTGVVYDFSYVKDFIDGFLNFISSVKTKNIKVYFVGIEKKKFKSYYDILKLKKKFPSIVKIISQVDIQTATNYQISASVLVNFIAGDPATGLIGAKAYSYAATGNPTLTIPEIKNRKTLFFPNRDIHKIAVNAFEVKEYLEERYKMYRDKKSLKTSITKEEIYSISREYYSNLLISFIKQC